MFDPRDSSAVFGLLCTARELKKSKLHKCLLKNFLFTCGAKFGRH